MIRLHHILSCVGLLVLSTTTISQAPAQQSSEIPAWAKPWDMTKIFLPKEETTFSNFVYDRADAVIPSATLSENLAYDSDVLSADGELYFTWLQFTPVEGDRIWFAGEEGGNVSEPVLLDESGCYANPTLTVDARGRIWLSYEQERDGQWDILTSIYRAQENQFSKPRVIADSDAPDIHHSVAADGEGGLWFVWQTGRDGQFDIVGRRVLADSDGPIETISDSPRGDWHPDIAVTSDGGVHVVWDAYNGESFNVRMRSLRNGIWREVIEIASSPAFEGRAQIAPGRDDIVWVVWEEGTQNWGHTYLSRLDARQRDQTPYEEMNELCGPLHTYRLLRTAAVLPDGSVDTLRDDLPMPCAELAREREHDKESVSYMGAFYERPELETDAQDRLWLAYRHYFATWLGIEYRSHVEQGWGVYARCLTDSGWSKLHRFNVGQGDGMQRLEIAAHEDRIAAVWSQGRTDRRMNKDDRPRGVFWATVEGEGDGPDVTLLNKQSTTKLAQDTPEPRTRAETVQYGGKEYQLFFGDLHRHTDLSLCRVPVDGTIDDAYRYAIEVAELDFLGITDHSRDIALGDHLSHLWWRNRKEVSRHFLTPLFFPFYSYERSHGNTADHNVVSLRDDILRPHTYPVPEFWKELDENTITIPHQPLRQDTWNYQDDDLRPLIEIFQGCRTRSIEDGAHEGLSKGYHLGFIASSDHMSTAGSYACVWAEDETRESVFRSMQARRTYGATAKIRLLVRAGGHWMGEIFKAETMPPIEIDATGTSPFKTLEIIVDGNVEKSVELSDQSITLSESLDLTGEHWIYIHLIQEDGRQAWSSPMWVEIGTS